MTLLPTPYNAISAIMDEGTCKETLDRQKVGVEQAVTALL
jgi:hypothetical protein